MPRIRAIKPQFWLDEDLGALPRDTRLLYIGLWNLCDDTGVFEYRPARIKVQIFPYDKDIDEVDVGAWLEQLAAAGNLRKFTHDGQDYGWIPSFLKHQEINRPSLRTFAPIPEEWKNAGVNQESQGAIREPSVSPTTRSRIKGKGKGVGNKEKIKDTTPPLTLGQFGNVILTDAEYAKLVERFGKEDTADKIERLSEGMASKGYKYKSHYATILSWDRKDGNDGKQSQARAPTSSESEYRKRYGHLMKGQT